MAAIQFTVNGKARSIDTDPARPLLDVLREEFQLTGPKYGCGEGQCRACTVLIDGRATVSCVTPVRSVQGKSVTTIEGLSAPGKLHPVQQAFVDEGALQCGYCTPGMILASAALLQRNPRPTEAEIVSALNGNVCRCCGYPRIVAAVRRAAGAPGGAQGGAGRHED